MAAAALPVFVPQASFRSQRGSQIIIAEYKFWYQRKRKIQYVEVDGVEVDVGLFTQNLKCAECHCNATITFNEFAQPGENPWSEFHVNDGYVHADNCYRDEESVIFEVFKEKVYILLRESTQYATVASAYEVVAAEYARYRPHNPFHPLIHFKSTGNKIIASRHPAQPRLIDLQELDIPHDLTVTLSAQEAFLLHKDTYMHPPCPKYPQGRVETILIYGTAKMFKDLCRALEVFADGCCSTALALSATY
jgi:hypothetical protein